MYSILINQNFRLTRDQLISALRKRGIDSRPFFYPLDILPPYKSANPCPVALKISKIGINLPSSPSLSDDQIHFICETLHSLGKS